MSVCSQMGNGHGKGEKKKKKDLEKKATGHVDDAPRGKVEVENGDLQQEGTQLFHQERSRRRDVVKDLAKQRSSPALPDCGDGELNVGSQGDVSPEAIQGGVRYCDSSLACSNKSDMVCGDIMAGEHNKTTTGPELVESGMGSGGSTGNAVGNIPVEVLGDVPVDVPGNNHVHIPANVTDDIPDTVPNDAPGNVTGDISGTVPVNVLANVTDGIRDTASVDAAANVTDDIRDTLPADAAANVTDDILHTVPDDASANNSDHVEIPGDVSGACGSGVVPKHASLPNQTIPGMVSTQKKMPTTGDDFSGEPDETGPECISSYQSTQPTPPSKIESSSPAQMQLVSGVDHANPENDGEKKNLKVTDQLISEVVTDNSLFLEKLSKYLDRESRFIRCWKHLAYVLNVPPEERNRFDAYTEHSPTEDLFNYLSDIWNPDLTVKELKEKLKLIHRNDVIADIEKGGFQEFKKVSNLISGEPKFIKLLTPKLDIESRTIGNWRSLATEFGIRKQKTEQFGLRGSGPAGALFLYMRTAEGLCDLNMAELQSHFEKMERKDLVNLLTKHGIKGSSLVKDVLVDGSELLADIGERLNKEIRAVKNWRNLAYRLNISNETYSAFDTSKEKAKSPTKMMFEWLAKWKPALNIGDLLKSVKEIDRFDVVEIITKEAQAALDKVKKNKEASKQQCTSVDGPAEWPTGNQALLDLQQMHQDVDQESVKTFKDFLSNLERNAFVKGFRISDNPGQGNCMFYALSEQLKFVKRRQYSAAELRQELVQYLRQNPKQPNGTDLFNFTHGYSSWTSYLETMAKDGTWGDNVMLWAAANFFSTPIRVISSLADHEDIIIDPQLPDCHNTGTLLLGHVHEEHYVSLLPLLEVSDEGLPRGDPLVLYRNGQDSQYGQRLGGYQQKQVSQQQQQRQGYFQSQGYQQMQLYQQRTRDQELHQRRGYQQPQDNKQRPEYPYHPSDQQLHGQRQRPPLEVKVLDLPLRVYSKICLKLNIKRDVSFDDFRMLAEELGMDRDTTAFVGQQISPTDFIFSVYNPEVTVGELVNILRKIERFDVAAVLDEWIQQTCALIG